VVKVPYYKPAHRTLSMTLLLLVTLVVLSCTGLGIVRLSFDGGWNAGQGSGELFAFTLRGASVFDPRTAEPLGSLFWIGRAVALALVLLLPWCTTLPGTVLAGVAATGITVLHVRSGGAPSPVPLEFDLLDIGVLTAIWALVSWARVFRDRQRVSRLLGGQYVPPELAAAFSRHPETMGLSGEAREVSVLFCDVVGYSAVSEALAPQQVAEWLNGFFECVSRVVVRHRGTIDKLMGDSVMVVWGAPARSRTHAFDALRASLDIVRELEALNAVYLEKGLPPLAAGIGLSTGLVNVGPLGSEYRVDYTVVGDSVNVAQRLEKLTRTYGVPIIVSDSTAEALPDVLFRELDTAVVKGRGTPVTLYAPVGPRDEVDERTHALLELHRSAMEAGRRGDWATAQEGFERLRDEWGPERLYELYLHGIAQVSGAGTGSTDG